jgi:enoyl-CoA hydratase/carnithine racemase
MGSPCSVSPAPEPAVSGGGSIGLSVAQGIAHLVLRREDGRNAISPAFLDELETALDAVAEAQHVKLLVLRGEGKVFSVGVDLAAIESLPPREALDFFRRGRALIRRLDGLHALTVAAINGLALGGGFELALACDLRWAHSRAVFGFPECRRGLIPAWGGIRFLHRHLASEQALALVTTGDSLGVRSAYSVGLVHRIFEGRDFLGQVSAVIETLFSARDAQELRALKAGSREPADAWTQWHAAEAAAVEALWLRRAAGARAAGLVEALRVRS